MLKEYTINFKNILNGEMLIGYANAHNTEELHAFMGFTPYSIVSVRKATEE